MIIFHLPDFFNNSLYELTQSFSNNLGARLCKLSILSSYFSCESIHISRQQLKFGYIKMLTKTFFSCRPEKDLIRISSFNWFSADFQILLICSLKFSLYKIREVSLRKSTWFFRFLSLLPYFLPWDTDITVLNSLCFLFT